MNQQEKHNKEHDDEQNLNLSTTEPLELDDQYVKPKVVVWGRCYPIMFRKGNPIFIIGPHWPLFICAFTMFFVMSGVFIFLRLNDGPKIFYSTMALCINQCLSYLIVALINPGIANFERNDLHQNSQPNQSNPKTWYCQTCKLIQLKETKHCYDCDICISGFDHHCPWTGKCIGEGNIKQFYYFIGSSVVFMVFNFTLILLKIREQDMLVEKQ